MIDKTKLGFQVKSEGGKNLSKPNLTHAEAVTRLKAVEYFKHHDQKRAGKKK
jgi:hypothetical protein